VNDVWDWILHISGNLETGLLNLVDSWWIYPGIWAFALTDAVIPVVPSESVVILVSTTSQQVGQPLLPLIFVAAALGAWCGDQIAYLIGNKVDVRNLRVFRRPRVLAALDWAEHALERRGTLYIIAGRFIPMGRLAVNLSAGALRYPHRRFMGVAAIAAAVWASWSILIGTVASSLFGHDANPLLPVVVGVVGGVVMGLAVDRVLRLFGLSAPELPDLADEIEHRVEEEHHRAAPIESGATSPEDDRT